MNKINNRKFSDVSNSYQVPGLLKIEGTMKNQKLITIKWDIVQCNKIKKLATKTTTDVQNIQ